MSSPRLSNPSSAPGSRAPSSRAGSLVPVVACASLVFCQAVVRQALAESAPPRSRVSVGVVEERVFSLRLELLGEIEAVRASRPSSEVDGLAEEVLVDEGTPVEAGQPLVRLSTAQRQIQRRRAEAELRQVEEQLREYRAGNRPEEIRQAEEVMKSAKALLDEVDDNLRRMESLHERGTVSDQELTTARAKALAARAVHAEALAAYDLQKAGPRAEVIARAEAMVAMKQAELDQIDDEIRRAEIPAPFAGVVTEKLVERGDYVKRGDPVAALVQLDPIRASLAIPESIVERVHKGTAIEILADALSGEKLSGTVEAIVPQGDSLARTFPLKVELANPARRLFPAMSARGVLTLPSPKPSLAVPVDAIVRTDTGGVLVYAVRDGRAALVAVTPGLSEDGLMEVRGPLRRGEQVIVRGNERVFPGTPVEILEPTAEHPAAEASPMGEGSPATEEKPAPPGGAS